MDQALSSSTEPDQNARLDQRLLQYGIIGMNNFFSISLFKNF